MMEYRLLGSSGCAVSALALGTLTFGNETDQAASFSQLDWFTEAGGTLVDSADVYADGRAEEIIGRWLADRPGRRELVVLATKGRFPTDESPNGHGLSRRHLSLALDASLRRLNVETIDLYQLHAWDPLTRVADRQVPTRRAGPGWHPGGGERRRGDANLEPARPVRADLAGARHGAQGGRGPRRVPCAGSRRMADGPACRIVGNPRRPARILPSGLNVTASAGCCWVADGGDGRADAR